MSNMKSVIERLNQINESPYLHDSELFYHEIALISKNALNNYYSLYGIILNDIYIYHKNDNNAYVVGLLDDENNLVHFLDIQISNKIYPVEPKQLSSYYDQINMVIINKEIAQQGIASSVYKYILSKNDIVSDYVQYKFSKKLWISLAKSNIGYIYVFDCVKKDYFRDSDKKIIVYNGFNIDENEIWGKTLDHQNRLLVGSMRKFN